MILDHLGIEYLQVMDLGQQTIGLGLVMQILLSLLLLKDRLRVPQLQYDCLKVSSLLGNLLVNPIVLILDGAYFVIRQIDHSEDVGIARNGRCMSVGHLHAGDSTLSHVNFLVLQEAFHDLFLGLELHTSRRSIALDLLWRLILVIVDVLLYRVAGSQHIHDLFLVLARLNPQVVAFSLGVHGLLPLDVQNLLA